MQDLPEWQAGNAVSPPPVIPFCNDCGVYSEQATGADIYPHRPDLFEKIFCRCPGCGARVGCHPGTHQALGALATADTRRARMAAHAAFDPLWQSGRMARVDAYTWLATALGLRRGQCHIWQMGADVCNRVVELLRIARSAQP